MYKISVPVICNAVERQGREKILAQLRAFNAERVFLSVGSYELDPEKRKALLECLKRECAYFHAQGFEVGTWLWTFMVDRNSSFDKMYALKETEAPILGNACPLGERFSNFAAAYVADLAKCGVDLIMFDDDFRYSSLEGSSAGCLCPLHRARINELVGEELDHETLARRITSGGKNKYRDAWLSVNGEAFRAHARRMRAAVDAVDPKIRMGACACLSSWDLDGIDAYSLARELAGSTRPFVRLIGASYWAARRAWGCRMGDVIEQERMEAVWTRRDDEIEIFSEGDCYPRPRIECPAVFVEALDTAMRADGGTDGILKYGIDYISTPDYETGYVKAHLRNKTAYEAIDRLFGEKKGVGVRVYEYPKKVANMEVTPGEGAGRSMYYSYFSGAARAFSQTAIPTVYEGEGVTGACFGESAHSLTHEDCMHGMILDGSAAVILTGRGFDVGISTVGARVAGGSEVYVSNGEWTSERGNFVYDHGFASSIEPLSHTEVDGKRIIASYRYENADGERFLVINADGRVLDSVGQSTFRHYARARQYIENVAWLSRGQLLPASISGHPDLYMMTKKGADGALSVGLWNFSADPVFDPEITLDGVYTSAEGFRCVPVLKGDRVLLEEDVPAFGFAAFKVKK